MLFLCIYGKWEKALSLTVVWVIQACWIFLCMHKSSHPTTSAVSSQSSLSMYVWRHVLVHKFLFSLFSCTLPPPAPHFGHVWRLNTPQLSGLLLLLLLYALKWKVSASLFLFSLCIFCLPGKCFFCAAASSPSLLLMSFLYRIDAINGASELGKSWGAHKKPHWMFKQKLANGFVSLLHITHIKVDCARPCVPVDNYCSATIKMNRCVFVFVTFSQYNFSCIFMRYLATLLSSSSLLKRTSKWREDRRRGKDTTNCYIRNLFHTL